MVGWEYPARGGPAPRIAVSLMPHSSLRRAPAHSVQPAAG